MRVTPAVPLILIALTACASAPPTEERPKDLTIPLLLELKDGRCVVRFEDTKLKDPRHAIAWTDHAVIWQVVRNGCGDKKKETPAGKALGLRHLKRKNAADPVPWFYRCDSLGFVPARAHRPAEFRCYIPSANEGDFAGEYEYEIEGDSIEPADPGLGINKNG